MVLLIAALVVTVALGVGLPVAGWLLSKRMQARQQPIDGLGPPTDPVDRWLIEHHHLPATQRWQVRNAVLRGRALKNPALRAVAHDLASGVLQGEVKLGRGFRIGSYFLLAAGTALIIFGASVWPEAGAIAGVVPMLWGAHCLIRAAIILIALRRGPTRAYQLNT